MKDDIVAEVKVNAGGDNGISEDQPEESEDKTDEGKMEVDAEETPETKDAVEPEPQKTPAKRGRKKKVVKEVDEDEDSDEEDLPRTSSSSYSNVGSMYDDICLLVARSYTFSTSNPFSLISPLCLQVAVQPSYLRPSPLPPPLYFHFHRPPS